MACYNSPFREHLKNMTLELAENYPVDGFFFDCLGAYPCVCEYCVKEMKEKGIDITDTEAVTKFSAFSAHRMCEYLNEAIRRVKPDALLFFNGRPFEEVIHMESHLECECLPTAGWGYECLPICAHYMRTVAGPDKSVLNMTGRFNDWGDFGGLRTAEGLEYDLFYGAANGQRPDIGGHFHPRGDLLRRHALVPEPTADGLHILTHLNDVAVRVIEPHHPLPPAMLQGRADVHRSSFPRKSVQVSSVWRHRPPVRVTLAPKSITT